MKFSIPSVQIMASKSQETLQRFPFVLLMALVACISGIWITEIEFSNQDDYTWLSGLTFISVLGISFLFAIKTLSESLKWNSTRSLMASLAGVLILAVYYIFSYDKITEGPDMHGYRFALLFLASHLFVSFSAFIKRGSIEEFWGYNKTLFLEFLTSALYSAVLFAGLSIALLSVDVLLFDINDERYFQLWIFMATIFNTIFFLSRVPKTDDFSDSVTHYPKALKVFVQYVLIPLVTVYILILYTYMGKIIVQWELPTGWVANLVLSFSIAGIFSLLLLHPIKDEDSNNWIRLYSKTYFLALIPLVLLLFISIGTRISEYGVTINRFFVATLAVWLAGIVLYFIFSKSRNIKAIPISLCLVALAITYGPLSAFSVSERSQKGRLVELLSESDRLSESNIIQTSEIVTSLEQNTEISSINRYLISAHGIESLESFFQSDLDILMDGSQFEGLTYISKAEKVTRLMNIKYVDRYNSVEVPPQSNFNFYTSRLAPVNIDGYDLFFDNLNYYKGNSTIRESDKSDTWTIDYDEEREELLIYRVNFGSVTLPILSEVEKIMKDYGIGSQELSSTVLTFQKENEQISVKLLINNISGTIENDSTEITTFSFSLFLKEKQ